MWARCLHQHAKGDEQRDKDDIMTDKTVIETVLDEGCSVSSGGVPAIHRSREKVRYADFT